MPPRKTKRPNAIQRARIRAGLTQAEAARNAGWKQPVWARFEIRPDAATLRTYRTAAKALGCSIKALVEDLKPKARAKGKR